MTLGLCLVLCVAGAVLMWPRRGRATHEWDAGLKVQYRPALLELLR